jgi:hypothetical protein
LVISFLGPPIGGCPHPRDDATKLLVAEEDRFAHTREERYKLDRHMRDCAKSSPDTSH